MLAAEHNAIFRVTPSSIEYCLGWLQGALGARHQCINTPLYNFQSVQQAEAPTHTSMTQKNMHRAQRAVLRSACMCVCISCLRTSNLTPTQQPLLAGFTHYTKTQHTANFDVEFPGTRLTPCHGGAPRASAHSPQT
jgi:hypothetical protein